MISKENAFWAKVKRMPGDVCWLWSGYIREGRYGILYWNYGGHKAHRASYEINVGPIPSGIGLLMVGEQD